jgi:hypothetical protein
MSRYVKIISVGGDAPHVPAETSDQGAVEIVLQYLDNILDEALWDKPDIVSLPEHVCRPGAYSLNKTPSFFDKIEPAALNLIKEKAKKHRANIIHSGYYNDGGKIYNAQRLVNREGFVTGLYKKTFPMPTEIEAGVTPGGVQGLMESDVGTIAGAICFDLNFRPLLDYRASLRPDMVIFSSNYPGGLMQQVWAYFCRAHFIGTIHRWPNTFLNPAGMELFRSTPRFPISSYTINLDGALFHVDFNQANFNGFDHQGKPWFDKFEAAKKYYGPDLKISDPGELFAVYISSESKDFTIKDVVKKFEFEPLDGYFDRSIQKTVENSGDDFSKIMKL